MFDQMKKGLTTVLVACCWVGLSAQAQTPPSKAPQQGQAGRDEYCSHWHDFSTICGDALPAETVRGDLRNEAYKVIVCKAVCDAAKKRNPPMSADVVTQVGSTATVKTISNEDKKGMGSNGLSAFYISFTPTPNTDEVHVLAGIVSEASSVRFDNTPVIHPGGTATLGNGTWQIVITRTE